MKSDEVTVGKVVQLKSGGPKMTVKGRDMLMNGLIKCQWFAGKKLEAGHFEPETLIPAKDDGEGN